MANIRKNARPLAAAADILIWGHQLMNLQGYFPGQSLSSSYGRNRAVGRPGCSPNSDSGNISYLTSCFKNPGIGFYLLLFSHLVVSSALQPRRLQDARLPCPSLSPRVCSNSCPLRQWCHPTISSSVIPFSSYPRSFPAQRSFPACQLFPSGGQSIRASASHQSFQWIFRTDFL